jgi:hypothetical protein
MTSSIQICIYHLSHATGLACVILLSLVTLLVNGIGRRSVDRDYSYEES